MSKTNPRLPPNKSFYVVVVDSQFGSYAPENDRIYNAADLQWKSLVQDVADMQIENVIGCHFIDTERGTCVDKMEALAIAVNDYFYMENEDPHEDVRDWIESILDHSAFETDEHRRERIASQRADYAIDVARGK